MPNAPGQADLPQSLAWAHPVVQEWFVAKFGTPTEPQEAGWPAILRGDPTLISAPTGSGKTLSAFLVAIDDLLRRSIVGNLAACTHVLYISPLKALSNDIQKNLDGPLAEIQQLALERGYLSTGIRTGVRTGDTPQSERVSMLRHPPHILVTTPESLYLLLTAGKSREHLRRVRTVIVDEIHAIAGNKRGSHLCLSLERLDALVCGENTLSAGAALTGFDKPPQRIGLSATQNPIELVASFLTGVAPGRTPATIIQVGQRRHLNLSIEVPSDELGSLTTNNMWEEIFDKLAACTEEHRSTLVFVNTRRLVEKIAFCLSERLGPEHVAAHHGSLSRALRLDAEQRLKNGEIKILIATASLELGIDIGSIDLVCQIASTRAVATAMQRVGRAGHWRGAIPKGRFFATTRDDLLEQAALVLKMHAGELDLLEIPPAPRDVLMQQIVACCGAESWCEDQLFNVLRRAYPYRDLTRALFNELVVLLSEGIESSRGRYGAYLLRDGINHQLHPRRGARMIAIANGGAIPDSTLFAVILQPEGVQIATLGEHFAVDSSPGDVVLLGNTSWRITRIESAGKVMVEDAHGAPPSIPFWEGEAPQRTAVLSGSVSDLREQISSRTIGIRAGYISAAQPEVAAAIAWLTEACAVCASGALQLVTYIVTGRDTLGCVPTRTTIVAERFFDDGGGMQLILHAPFGGRINKAWGLALRKRFCRGFNFELQAAATDNGINIALAEQHSFPLAEVFQFLTEHTAKELLEQAAIASPIFKTRWRWAANRSLQLLRFSKGKRVPPQIARTRSDDLLANVFPQAAACFETIVGDIQIPDHPLVDEVMYDVLQEAMDLEGLNEVLRGIASGAITCLAVDTPAPSIFAHEMLNANPYAFLDDADANERRAKAVNLHAGALPAVQPNGTRLDPAAIARVRRELMPDLRDEHELHDLLHQLVLLPLDDLLLAESRHWPLFFERLTLANRALPLKLEGRSAWCAAERHSLALTLKYATDKVTKPCTVCLPEIPPDPSGASAEPTYQEAVSKTVQGWLQITGPVTAAGLAVRLALEPDAIYRAFLAMEMQGLLLRGVFESAPTEDPHRIEWCERRILQRIHRLTLETRRKQVEAINPAAFMRWLLVWQHLAPQTQLTGEAGVLEALQQLEGFEAPAIEWERTLLPARVADYDPRWLDQLCLSGVVGWGRISPHPAWSAGQGSAPRRVIPTNAAPITFYLRDTADWLPHALAQQCVEPSKLAAALSPEALTLRSLLAQRGASFTADLTRLASFTRQQTQHALWELATAGLAAADGFDQLRAMMNPGRRAPASEPPATNTRRRAALRTSAGRWSLLAEEPSPSAELPRAEDRQASASTLARRTDAAIESAARMLLARYGVLFRDLLVRESNAPKWRDLLPMLRRLEARGEVRGGRFVSGFGGEQFALPAAVESLHQARHTSEQAAIAVAAADPINLAGIVVPGERIASVPGRFLHFINGAIELIESPSPALAPGLQPLEERRAAASARTRAIATASTGGPRSPSVTASLLRLPPQSELELFQ